MSRTTGIPPSRALLRLGEALDDDNVGQLGELVRVEQKLATRTIAARRRKKKDAARHAEISCKSYAGGTPQVSGLKPEARRPLGLFLAQRY